MKKLLVLFTILGLGVVGCSHQEIIERRFSPEKGGVAKWYPNSNVSMNNSHADEIVAKIKDFCGGDYIKVSERDAMETDGWFVNFGYLLVDFRCKTQNQTSEKKPDVEKNSR